MALPYEVVVPVFLTIAAALGLGLVAAPRLTGAVGRSWAGRVRVVSGVALVVIVAGVSGLYALGAPIDPNSRPLQFGSAFGGSDPRLLETRDFPGTGVPGLQEYDYAYSPGAQISNALTIANGSGVPLTLLAISAETQPGVSSIEFRLPSRLSSDLPPTYENEYPDQPPGILASQPFHSFGIPARGEIGLAVRVTLGQCLGTQPVPTLAAGESLLPGSDPTLAGGYDVLTVIDVRYVQLGIERSETIALPFVMHVITSAKNVYGCPSA